MKKRYQVEKNRTSEHVSTFIAILKTKKVDEEDKPWEKERDRGRANKRSKVMKDSSLNLIVVTWEIIGI